MKKFLSALLALLIAAPASATPHFIYSAPAPIVASSPVYAAMFGAIHAPLASIPLFATFYSGGSGTTYLGTTGQIVITSGVIKLADPIVPTDGTQNFTGAAKITGAANVNQLSVLGASAQTDSNTADLQRWYPYATIGSSNDMTTGISPAGNLRFGYNGGTGITWRGAGLINQNAAYVYSDNGYNLFISTGGGLGDNLDKISFRLGGVEKVTLARPSGVTTFTVNGAMNISGVSDVTQLKIIQKSGQTAVPLQLFAADGTTNLFSINAAGLGNFGQGANFAGQVSNTSVYTGTAYDDNATATVKALPVAGTGWTFEVPNGKGVFVRDSDQNLLAQIVDDGTTGSLVVTGSKSKGQVTLNANGSTNSTVTVNSGAICVISGESALVTPAHSVSGTTLTIVNSVTNANEIIDYLCL